MIVKKTDKKNNAVTMWIGVGVVFALMAMAWTAMFFFASKNPAHTVPLETPRGVVKP